MTLLVTKSYKPAYSYLVKHLIFIMVLETRCSSALDCRREIAYPSSPTDNRRLMTQIYCLLGVI